MRFVVVLDPFDKSLVDRSVIVIIISSTMEDTKTTDKRKAPDKNTSSDLDDSLSIEQQPLKRPRMDDPTVFEEDFEILEQTGVEAVSGEGEVNRVDTAISTSDGDSNQVISQPDDEGLVVSTPAGLNDTAIALDISEVFLNSLQIIDD